MLGETFGTGNLIPVVFTNTGLNYYVSYDTVMTVFTDFLSVFVVIFVLYYLQILILKKW